MKVNLKSITDCKNFSDLLYYHSAVNPDRVYIYDIRSERSYTFKQFNEVVEKTANFLISKGVRPGDRITAVIENSPEYCFFYFASIRIGAIFNPMPFASHKKEILKNVVYVEPSIVLIDKMRFNEFTGEGDKFKEIPVGNERLFEKSIDSFSNTQETQIEIDGNKPACLYYSSGTTGAPKGVLFSHNNMIANISSICRGFKFSSINETHLVLLPLGHTASTNYSLLPCMYIGGKLIIAESFWQIRGKIWELIQEHNVTYMEVVATVLYAILNMYNNTSGCNVSSLRFVGCGSAPLQKSIQTEFKEKYKLKVANLYGLSETGPTHIDDPLENNWECGSIGFPLDVNDVKIFDENDNELEPFQEGEIVIKGKNVFVGYYKNDSLYKNAVRNEYFHTGDLGYMDNTGRFYFVDRLKDLIIKGGVNIAPGEIDEILLLHPAVKEVATIGIPNDILGEEIRSFIVLKDGFVANEREIIDHCRKNLNPVKIPKEIKIIDNIPKTHSGKLLKRALKNSQ